MYSFLFAFLRVPWEESSSKVPALPDSHETESISLPNQSAKSIDKEESEDERSKKRRKHESRKEEKREKRHTHDLDDRKKHKKHKEKR